MYTKFKCARSVSEERNDREIVVDDWFILECTLWDAIIFCTWLHLMIQSAYAHPPDIA